MARFLKHVGCEQCGSSDANGIYDDGSQWCFSCQHLKPSKVSPYVTQPKEEQTKTIALPLDVTQEYSEDAVKWIVKYITLEQALSNGLLYSAYRNQVIFPFYDADKHLLAYQARNLSPESKARRYYTSGDVNGILPVYSSSLNNHVSNGKYICSSLTGNSRVLGLVEDCLSAIKVASINGLGIDAMPLLGSGISRVKLSRLRPFYDVLHVFLDPDMFHKAQTIAKQAQMLGFHTNIVKAMCDPKEHTEQQLTELLK